MSVHKDTGLHGAMGTATGAHKDLLEQARRICQKLRNVLKSVWNVFLLSFDSKIKVIHRSLAICLAKRYLSLFQCIRETGSTFYVLVDALKRLL